VTDPSAGSACEPASVFVDVDVVPDIGTICENAVGPPLDTRSPARALERASKIFGYEPLGGYEPKILQECMSGGTFPSSQAFAETA